MTDDVVSAMSVASSVFAAEARDAQVALDVVALVRSAHDSVIGLTLDGRVRSWNPGAQRLYGYDSSEMLGQKFSRIVAPERHFELPELTARILKGGSGVRFESERITKSDGTVSVSVIASPIRDEAGDIIGISFIARELPHRRTDHKQLRALLKKELAKKPDLLAKCLSYLDVDYEEGYSESVARMM